MAYYFYFSDYLHPEKQRFKSMTKDFVALFEREINKLIDELQSTPEDELWQTKGKIKNPIGTLGLHLAGNLQHFIGATLGDTGYKRDRVAEFDTRNLPVKEVVDEVQKAKTVVIRVLSDLNPKDLEKTYPLEPFGYTMSSGYMLLHLYGHLNYHVGQINYLRRSM
jgi:uncharacterized damage-inducible protein DinB